MSVIRECAIGFCLGWGAGDLSAILIRAFLL